MSYCTLAQIKEFLDITTTDDDALITRLIGAAEAQINQYTGKVFAAVTETRHLGANSAYISSCGRGLTVPWYLVFIDSITIDDNAVDAWTAVLAANGGETITEVWLDNNAAVLWTSYSTSQRNTIAITGKYGYSTTPPSDIVNACVMLTAYLYQVKDRPIGQDAMSLPAEDTVKVSQGIPLPVTDILKRYEQMVDMI